MSSRRSRSGGSDHRDDPQAIIEVLAEAPFAHRGLEVVVGRGDQPDVDA